MSNEIKVGDKVRVSEKTPIEYNPHGEYAPLCVINSVVRCVVNDYAMCEPIWDDGAIQTPFLIPTKYLVKVDAEEKEAKFKVGDRVEELVSRKSGRVLGVEGDFVVVGCPYDKEKNYWHIDSVELVEPTEQTEAEKNDADNLKKVAEEWANTVSNAIKEYGDAACMILIDAHTGAYWDAYTADLAKEIAVKVANKYNDPKEVAEYAVLVAKAVVEGLKRK